MPASVGDVADPDERLFWTLMRRFETLALDRYDAHAPDLATPEKRAFVSTIAATSLADADLAAHDLAAPTDALLAAAASRDAVATLIVQGLVLEHLAQTIYGIVAATEQMVGETSRALARIGRAASASVTAEVPARLDAALPDPAALWTAFAAASHDVLAALDGLADPVDRVFGLRFDLRFADVMGDFIADLIGACTSLGMPRRKVVAHLAGAAMGL
jgi:hypothetical protein